MKNKELIPNAPILIESTRSIGYSFEAAIADIVDNSIGKNASLIEIEFDSSDDQYVAIIDDACGMSSQELEMAMQYGSKSSLLERDKNDLGRFGLGLKMASLSQCRSLTVISKRDGVISGARWDLDHIMKTNRWSLIVFEKNEIEKMKFVDKLTNQNSGTIVIWQNFDRVYESSNNIQKTFDEKMIQARNHIALVFHRFLSGNNSVKIFMNNELVIPLDPFLENNPATQRLVEQTIFIDNKEIKVKPFILPYISKLNSKDKKQIGDIQDLRQNQGFYIYRNKRLIIAGTWFRLSKRQELNKLARIRVDIPNSLDSIWEIDIKKSTASLPDKIKRNLNKIVEETIGKSEKVFKYRGRKIKDADAIYDYTWNVIDNRGELRYEINKEAILFKQLVSLLNQEQLRYLESFITTIEDAFPFTDVYYRMAKSPEIKPNNQEDFEKLYQIGMDMIQSSKELGLDTKVLLQNLDKNELFKERTDVTQKLMEDFDFE